MNSFKLLATLFMYGLSSFAYSENDKEYMIEVIVFEQLEIIGNEKLEPKNLNLIDIKTIALLDKPKIVVNEEIISQSFNHDHPGFLVDQQTIDQMIDGRTIEDLGQCWSAISLCGDANRFAFVSFFSPS